MKWKLRLDWDSTHSHYDTTMHVDDEAEGVQRVMRYLDKWPDGLRSVGLVMEDGRMTFFAIREMAEVMAAKVPGALKDIMELARRSPPSKASN